MKKLASLVIATSVLSASMLAQANAWTRDTHSYGWHGKSSVHASGSCGGRSCSREVERTGPHGRSMSREGSVECGGGSCSASRSTTGPRGNTVDRGVTISR